MKILSVCQRGNTRSAGLAYLLKDEMGYNDVLACGITTVQPETFSMLATWADKIFVVAEKNIYDMIPDQYKQKSVNIDIGPDKWGNPFHPELLEILRTIITSEKLL